MKRRHLAAGFVAVTTAVGMAGAGAGMAQAAGNDNVRLSNSGRNSIPSHQAIRNTNAAAPLTGMTLALQVPLRNQALLDSMAAKGQVISPAEYTRLFGASPAALKKVADWAKKQGFTVTSSDAAGGVVNVSAPVERVNKAFSLKMYRVKMGARAGLAPDTDPQVPQSLGLSGVIGLTTVSQRTKGPDKNALAATKAQSLNQRTKGTVRGPGISLGGRTTAAAVQVPCADYWGQRLAVSAKKFNDMSNYQCAMSPQQGVKIYNAGAAANVTPNIGILLWDRDPNAKAKANALAAYYQYPLLNNYVDRSDTPGPQGDCGGTDYTEQAIDVQSSHAMAPKASIYYYGAKDCSDTALLSKYAQAVSEHKVSTLSMSFGQPEPSASSSFKSQFNRISLQAGATGISVFVSSGDMGDYSIPKDGIKPTYKPTVSFPSSSPYITAVGGTAIGLNSNGTRKFTVGWANTYWSQPNPNSTSGITQEPFAHNSIGAGGGISGEFAQPQWQKGVVTGSTTKRAVPDVAGIADGTTGLAFTPDGSSAYSAGGTSLASPVVAALVASSKAITKRSVGNAAPFIYKLRTNTSSILDVTGPMNKYGAVFPAQSGSGVELAGLGAQPDSLRTATGWDNETGVGEPAGPGFLTAFGG